MSLLDFLLRRSRRRPAAGPPLLPRLAARLPPDGGPGLLPAADDGEARAERQLGERFVAELHAWGAREPLGLGRRATAVASALGRRRPDELEEALEGLDPWHVPALLEILDSRSDLPLRHLRPTARATAERAADLRVLAAAIGLLALAPAPEDEPLLLLAGRSEALAGVCALAAEELGLPALLRLARVATGPARAVVLERLGLAAAERQAEWEPIAAEAIRLAGLVEDEPTRAYAAVPLLEVADARALLQADPGLAVPLVACIEATAVGGWNGGPGPGLGRLPGAIRAAEAVLGSDLPLELRTRCARAVLSAHPMPPGPIRAAAQALAA